MTSDDRRPHVVMLVANDVSNDTRVKKEALAVSAMGLDVTILGMASEKHPGDSRMGPVRIVRVPIAFENRERHRLRRRRFRTLPRPLRSPRTPIRQFRKLWRRAWWRYDYYVGRSTARARWRTVLPEILDYNAGFASVVEQLEPAVIHAHDMHVIGVADEVARRARGAGGRVPWIYDAHEFVPGLSQYKGRTPRTIAAWASFEAEHIKHADRVITVSPAIAVKLAQVYELRREPAVVLNTPVLEPPGGDDDLSIRAATGVAPGVPLLTYSGTMTHARGIQTAIEAMTALPDVVLAFVCVPNNATTLVDEFRADAEKRGVADRIHFLNPVPPGRVVGFLSSADIGLIPILPFPSHEMALPNKVFEYLHAELPVVSSDLETLGEFIRAHDVGETFRPEDARDLARAVRSTLKKIDHYREKVRDPQLLERYSWERQQEELRTVYEELLAVKLDRSVDTSGVVDLSESPVDVGTSR
jgi:glycosyltransferase involved in cell wall biosynthesis